MVLMEPQINSLSLETVKIVRHNPYSKMEKIIGIGIAVSAFVLNNNLDVNAGSPKNYHSTTKVCEVDDGVLTIIDANAQKNAGYVVGLINKYNADFATVQESQENDSQEIVDGVANSVGVFAPADWSVDPLGGGLGNMTISRSAKHSDEMRQFQGDTDWPGLASALWHRDLKKAGDAMKERRAALVTRFNVKIDGVKIPLNLMGVHVAGDPTGVRQTNEVLNYADQEMNTVNSVNVILGDFNRTPKEIRPSFERLHMPWVVSDVGVTSRDSERQIDHAIYQPFAKVGNKIFRVVVNSQPLPDLGSDHRAIKSTIHLKEVTFEDATKYVNKFKHTPLAPRSIYADIVELTLAG